MSIGELIAAGVPMVRTLDLEFLETGPERTVVVLPDRSDFHQHTGGPHPGALFALGESAARALVLAAFGERLPSAVPLAVGAEITHRALALGAVTATATLGQPAAETVAGFDGGLRPEFPVTVTLRRADGAVTAEMTVTWTLRPYG